MRTACKFDDNDAVALKTEDEDQEQRLLITPHQSTVAQFIRSGQVAFNIIDSKARSNLPNEVHKWMLDQVREKLAAATELSHGDVLCLRLLLEAPYPTNKTGYDILRGDLLRLLVSNLTFVVSFTNHILKSCSDRLPRPIEEDILDAVAGALMTIPLDMRDQQLHQHLLIGRTQPESARDTEPLPKASADALSVFVKHFYTLGRYGPIQNMLQHLQIEMPSVHATDLDIVYVPFLQDLIGLMLVYGVPFTNTVYKSFFQSVLGQYVKRFVCQASNQPSTTKYERWRERGVLAQARLEQFDHFYLREILGSWYNIEVLPIMLELAAL